MAAGQQSTGDSETVGNPVDRKEKPSKNTLTNTQGEEFRSQDEVT